MRLTVPVAGKQEFRMAVDCFSCKRRVEGDSHRAMVTAWNLALGRNPFSLFDEATEGYRVDPKGRSMAAALSDAPAHTTIMLDGEWLDVSPETVKSLPWFILEQDAYWLKGEGTLHLNGLSLQMGA